MYTFENNIDFTHNLNVFRIPFSIKSALQNAVFSLPKFGNLKLVLIQIVHTFDKIPFFHGIFPMNSVGIPYHGTVFTRCYVRNINTCEYQNQRCCT